MELIPTLFAAGSSLIRSHCWSTVLCETPRVSTYPDISNALLATLPSSCPPTLKHHPPGTWVWMQRTLSAGQGRAAGESVAARGSAERGWRSTPQPRSRAEPGSTPASKGTPRSRGKEQHPRSFAAFRPTPLTPARVSSTQPVPLPPPPLLSTDPSQTKPGLPRPQQSRSFSQSHQVSRANALDVTRTPCPFHCIATNPGRIMVTTVISSALWASPLKRQQGRRVAEHCVARDASVPPSQNICSVCQHV